jgi:DNA replication protein DnaC
MTSMHPYERWILRRYFATALRTGRFARPPGIDRDIVAWIAEHARLMALPDLSVIADESSRTRKRSDPIQMRRADWKVWRVAVMRASTSPQPNRSPLQKRLDWLSSACSLTEGEAALGLLARAERTPPVCSLIEALSDRSGVDIGSPDGSELELLLETSPGRGELSSGGRLAEIGMIEAHDAPRLSAVASRFFALPRLGARRVGDLLLGAPTQASLHWDDFEHLGDLRDLAARTVATAGTGKVSVDRGANLLFHGAPGTGKSEFAKTLGARIGFSVHFCGETNDENAEPNRRERIAALLIANAIGGIAKRTIIVVDEADDLLAAFDEEDGLARRGSKVFLNRLLERATAPTVWITNDIQRLGAPILRRMNLTLRFPKPNLSVRRAMIARIAAKAGFHMSPAAALDLARSPAPPALIDNAIRAAKRIRGSAKEARAILDGSLGVLGRPDAPQSPRLVLFDPTLSSADVDLEKLADQVAKSPVRDLSFCLSGAPGAGKSAYARHLAERLELDILEKRYSDLASMWVGECEKTIAAAFEEAADLRAFLIIDEVDSLLRDRRWARQSWEITQVNEMLTRMERHPYPFACTTNAPELLDSASARRFLLKVRFLQMTPSQVAEAFRRAFGAPAPGFVLKLSELTPGDFALVAKKATALRERDPTILGEWLEYEARAKPGASQQRIGF